MSSRQAKDAALRAQLKQKASAAPRTDAAPAQVGPFTRAFTKGAALPFYACLPYVLENAYRAFFKLSDDAMVTIGGGFQVSARGIVALLAAWLVIIWALAFTFSRDAQALQWLPVLQSRARGSPAAFHEIMSTMLRWLTVITGWAALVVLRDVPDLAAGTRDRIPPGQLLTPAGVASCALLLGLVGLLALPRKIREA